jgi:hypothetical protein
MGCHVFFFIDKGANLPVGRQACKWVDQTGPCATHVVALNVAADGHPALHATQTICYIKRPGNVELLSTMPFYTLVVRHVFAHATSRASAFLTKENFMSKWIAVIACALSLAACGSMSGKSSSGSYGSGSSGTSSSGTSSSGTSSSGTSSASPSSSGTSSSGTGQAPNYPSSSTNPAGSSSSSDTSGSGGMSGSGSSSGATSR